MGRNGRGVKAKKCQICGNEFKPFSSLGKVCSPKCAIEYAQQVEKQSYKRETLKLKRDFNAKDRRYQLKLAQAAFNAFIRERDKEQPCISCGTLDPNLRYDAGHYRTIGAHPELRFNEDNCFRQCHYNCNIMRSGNITDYRINLIKRIGEERVNIIEGDHQPKNYTVEEIVEIKKTYKEKLRAMQCTE